MGKAENMPFPSGQFGFANCTEVIEHVESPLSVLKEINRILVPGGMAYVSAHNRFGVYDKHFKLRFLGWMPRFTAERYIGFRGRHKNYESAPDRQKISQMHYFTYGGFKKLAETAGFKVCDIRMNKIIKRFSSEPLRRLAVVFYGFLRLFYFSTFHFFLIKEIKNGDHGLS